MNDQSSDELKRELKSLRFVLEENQEQLREAQEIIEAIRSGSVDGLVRSTEQGEQVFVLKGSDQPYRNLIEEMTEGALLISEDNTILYCNNGFAKMLNTELDKIIGSSIKDWISTADADKFLEYVSNNRLENNKRVFEITLQTKDKQLIPTQASINKLSMDSVSATGIIFVDLSKHMQKEVKNYTMNLEHEITQRKKAEDSLKYSNQRLELLYSTSNSLLSESNPQSLILDLSKKVMDFLDCDVFFNFLVDDEKGKLYLYAYEGVSSEKAKEIEWLGFGEAVCVCAAKEGNRIVCENIQDSYENKCDLVRSFGIKVYCANPLLSGGKVFGTLSFGSKEKSFFDTAELSLMKTVAALISLALERKRAEEAVTKSKELAERRAEELQVIKGKLEEKAAEVEEYANQMEELAQERLDKLRDSERFATVGQVAGMVGHDIRNPLQAITGDLYLAESDLALLPPSAEKTSALGSLKEIEKNIDYINKIVADLQDYSKVLKPVAKQVDLNALCQKVFEKNYIPENVDATCSLKPEAQTVMMDPDLLRRILDNLVSNALQAMPRGGQLELSAYKEGVDLVITVKDTGVGIPEENWSKLFTPLFTTRSKGQGFGLPVIKRMTEALGGKVTFESQVGRGTKFAVRFPPPKEFNGKWTYQSLSEPI